MKGMQGVAEANLTIFICGTSNSVMRNGWVPVFRDAISSEEQVENLSIGGAWGLIAAFRMSFGIELKPGDTILWECAVSDENYIYGGVDERHCLKYCEYLIRMAQRQGVRFLPLIFTPKRAELEVAITSYRAALHALFEHYGLAYVDVTDELRESWGVARLEEKVYMDGAHFWPGGPIYAHAGQRCAELFLADGNMPRDIAPLYVTPDMQIEVISDLDQREPTRFQNSLVTLPVHDRPALPAATPPVAFDGELAGIAFVAKASTGMATPEKRYRLRPWKRRKRPVAGGAHRITVGDQRIALSTTPVWEGGGYMVCCIGLHGLLGQPVPVKQGQPIILEATDDADELFIDQIFEADPVRGDADFKLIGYICERRAM